MLKLSLIKQYSTQVVSNPFKGIKRVFQGLSKPSNLESSPAVDTLVKVNPQNYILGANPGELIKKITSYQSNSFGKDASVFPIPNQENLVLRVEHTALEKMENLAENLKLIPIKHKENVISHDNLGLPLYAVVGKNSELYARESVSPIEALAQKDNIMVLKKVTGKHPVSATFDALMELMGVVEERPNLPQYINFQQLTQINKNYGKDAAKECLQIIKKGGEQNIPENYFKEGSEAFTFTSCNLFSQNYKNYVSSYLKYLKQLAKMPKESFKEAVDTILMDKNFLIDFQHTNNTFVDMKNKKFNFMDFEFDKTNAKYIYDNPVREFRNVILGKNFCKIARSPMSILLEDKDVKTAQKYSERITKKVNSVTPDEFKV